MDGYSYGDSKIRHQQIKMQQNVSELEFDLATILEKKKDAKYMIEHYRVAQPQKNQPRLAFGKLRLESTNMRYQQLVHLY